MLKQRVITALILVTLSLFDIFYASTTVWHFTVIGIAVLAALEWANLAKLQTVVAKSGFVVLSALVAHLMILSMSADLFVLLSVLQLAVFIGYVGLYQIRQSKVDVLSPALHLSIGALSIGLFTYALYVMHQSYGPAFLLLAMSAIWAIDSGAYFSGRKFGKNKLAVFVSPGKTWEGVIGGALITLILMAIIIATFDELASLPLIATAVILSLIAMLSVFGDLFESVLKRQADMKDSGKILPGHGGVLDRIDSLILALPLTLSVWYLFPNIAPTLMIGG